MSIRKYEFRDLVNTTEEFGERTFVIVSITKTGYRAVAMNNKKNYNITDEHIACKVGVISEDSSLLVQEDYDEQLGKEFCLHQAREFPAECLKWQALSKIKTGEKLRLIHRRTIFKDAVFVAVNFKKPRFPIRAVIKGLTHDFRLESMILED